MIKILIADDQQLIRDSIKIILESNEDFSVTDTVANGKEVLSSIEKNKPDVILMDVRMPVMDGTVCTKYVKEKYPNIKGPKSDDTCRATQVRQNAVAQLAKECDLVLIAGSKNSSNSNRLKEVAVVNGSHAYLIDDSTQIDLSWFENVNKVGLSAGASAPEYVVTEIVEFLEQHGASSVSECGFEVKEKSFSLPKEPEQI